MTADVPFDPFAVSGLLDEKMAAASVTLLYLTRVVDVMQKGGRITHLVLHNKSGFSAVPATLVVDATGDADVAVLSGCETVIGRRQDRLMTPVTLQVHMDGIDQEALAEYIKPERLAALPDRDRGAAPQGRMAVHLRAVHP